MKKLLILFTISFLFFFGCAEDSPLSDIVIDDPSLIKPDIEIYQHKNEDGGISFQHIVAFIYDKNQNTVKLNEGGVFVNTKSMVNKNLLLSSGSYYSGTEVTAIEIDRDYTFEIKLNHETSGMAYVRTQKKDLHLLTAPDEHNKQTNMIISWQEIDPQQSLILELGITYNTDTSSTFIQQDINIPSQNLSAGNFTIASSYFTNHPNTTKVRITLVSSKKGTMDQSFMSGSSIRSVFSISKEVRIY